jgi:exonuclease SbcC
LRASVAESEKEAVNGNQLAALASRAGILQSRETELTELLAQLRANQARDEKMQAEVQNGLCPILSQKCLNLTPGENLDDYFRHQFASYDERVASAETESTQVKAEVQAAREAEKQLARWETIKERLQADRQLLAERDASIKSIDRELQSIPSRIPALIEQERQSIAAIEIQENKANEDALLFAQLRPLRSQLEQVGARGARLSETRAELAAVADRIIEYDAALAENERKLNELADPRARVAALKTEAARVDVMREERATTAEVLTGLESELSRLAGELDRYAELEATLVGAITERDTTLTAHREYLANEPLAETIGTRESELAEAQIEKERIEQETQAAETALAEAQAAYHPDRHTADRSALAHKREEAAGTRALLKVQQQRHSALEGELTRLAAIRESLREQRELQTELHDLAGTTEFIRDTLKQAGPLVARSYLYNISVEANQIFREISGDASRSLRWTEDYEVLLEEEGHERPFHNLSGGEQMAAALAIRLALLKQLSDIRVAFFDEPTANLDTERRERLAQQIAQIQHFDQLFIISHDDTFEQSVDHIVHVSRPDPHNLPADPHADQLELTAAQHE